MAGFDLVEGPVAEEIDFREAFEIRPKVRLLGIKHPFQQHIHRQCKLLRIIALFRVENLWVIIHHLPKLLRLDPILMCQHYFPGLFMRHDGRVWHSDVIFAVFDI